MKKILISSTLMILLGICALAQTTEFTFQGSLNDGANPANANYDFEFRLFAADTGGTALGTLQRLAVPVSGGTFSVKLDFGAQFAGAARFLEIAVKPAGGGGFTTLLPRQPVSSTPYSVRSLNAANADSATTATNAASSTNALQLGGVAANQYVVTTDPRMTDARNPLPNSINYVQNRTSQQSSSNFNISGDGIAAGSLSANLVNSATQYNLAGVRMFAGNGPDNFGANIFTAVNTFIGDRAGFNVVPNPTPGNSLGKWNSFYGVGAGQSNVQGADNSFFGALAGLANTGGQNSFIGSQAGISNTAGILNTFVGSQSGFSNVQGNTNTFIGVGTDFNSSNSTGSGNTLLGIRARVDSGVSNGTAIGGRALVTQSNSLILGSINGVNNANADTNVGIGTTAPSERFQVVGNGLFSGNLTAANLNISGTGTIGSSLNVSANVSVGGNLTVAGTLNATLPVGSGNYIQNSPPSQQQGNFNINGTGIIGGGLGLGATPTAKLTVSTTTAGSDDNTAVFGAPSIGPNFSHIHYGTTGDWFIRSANSAGKVVLQDSGGNVGIGTSSPIGSLHVNMPSSGSPIRGLTLDVQSFQTTPNAVNSYFFKAQDLGAGSTPAFLIRGDGNVGIGTSTPSERLTVAGNAAITGTISGNGTGITNLGTNNLAADSNGPSTLGVPSTGVPFLIRYLTTGSPGTQVIYNNTTNPAPRNFLILDIWTILRAGNGGFGPLWQLMKTTNCGSGTIANFDASGIFGSVIRVERFTERVFTASTDNLVVCFAGTQSMEINILAVPMP